MNKIAPEGEASVLFDEKIKKLSSEQFFKSLLQQAWENGTISDRQMERLQMERLEQLSERCSAFNKHESSSVRRESAESLLNSLDFTIGYYLKNLDSFTRALEVLEQNTLDIIFRRGQQLLDVRFRAAGHLWLLTKQNKISTPHRAYQETLSDKGIGQFFQRYDQRFQAHEIPCSIDYQPACPVGDLSGLEYIRTYLKRLYLENIFCSCFHPMTVHRMMLGYDEEYWLLLDNIFQLVLSTALGCMLCVKDPFDLLLTEEDLIRIQKILTAADRDHIGLLLYKASAALMDLITEFDDKTKAERADLTEYINMCLPEITAIVSNAADNNCLRAIFLIARQ